jgi:AraC-like DNA-binding protein
MSNKLAESLKYLTISREDEAWGLSVTTVGFQIVEPYAAFPPAGHPSTHFYNPKQGRILSEYALVYFVRGSGKFSSRYGSEKKITAGSLLTLFPNEWHTYEPATAIGWESYWIGFKGDYANKLTRNTFFSSTEPIHNIGLNENLIELFNQAIYFANHEKTAYQQVLGGIVANMLGMVHYLNKNNHSEDKEIGRVINNAKSIMRERYEQSIDIEKIARELNVGYSWFRKMFKKYTGLSPVQYILQLKLHRAKAYLTSSDMPIKEIAYELNFDNPNYFYVFFKQKTGMTPKEFRNQGLNPNA